MLYSIQNAFGEVHGHFPMPETGMSADVLASELGVSLEDILGINGVRASPLRRSSYSEETEDRVVVDIDPHLYTETSISRVHQTIASMALSQSSE